MQSGNINELAAALAKAQTALSAIGRNREVKVRSKDGKTHYSFFYTTLDHMIETIRPALTGNGLWWVQTLEAGDNGKYSLATTLMHSSGQWIKGSAPILSAGTENQAFGSALTYMRRYCLALMLGIASDDDDDANAADGNTIETKRDRPPATVRAAPVSATPQRIDVPRTADGTAADWGSWGVAFVNAINSAPDAKTFQAWCDLNADPIKNMNVTEPKMAKALADRIAAGKAKWLEAA